MNEGEIRQAASMYALVAEMESVKANIEGMKAFNSMREMMGDSVAYNQEAFSGCENQLLEIAKRLATEI